MTGRWLLSRFGLWPLLIPLAWWLYCKLATRNQSALAGMIVCFMSVFGSVLFTYVCWQWNGIDRSLSEAAYRTLSLNIAQLGVLAAIVVWLRREETEADHQPSAFNDPPPLPVWLGTVKTCVAPREIVAIRSSRNYVDVLAIGETYLRRDTLRGLQTRSGLEQLFLVHRSWLVNPLHAKGLQRGSNQWTLVMRSGLQVPISRKHRDTVLAWFD